MAVRIERRARSDGRVAAVVRLSQGPDQVPRWTDRHLAFSRDETLMGFAFPKEEREAALETYPDKFLRPKPSDMRYQWLVVRLEAIDKDELRELVFDAWRMVVPKKLASLSDDEPRQQKVA